MIKLKRMVPVIGLALLMSTTAFAMDTAGEAPAITATPAAQTVSLHNTMNIGVLVIADSAYKSDQFMSELHDLLPSSPAGIYKIISGTEVQSKYQSYWLDKGFLEEQQLTPDVLKEFAKYSGYDKLVYILLKDPQMDSRMSQEGGGGYGRKGGGWFSTTVTWNRAYIEARVFLVKDDKIVANCNVTAEDDSKTSDLRARRGAFKKCIKEVNNKMAGYFAER